jgi:hypothetical protein
MRTAVILLCMAGAALAQQRSRPQEPPATDRAALGKTKKSDNVEVSIKTGTDIAYDDNFLDLNNRQIAQLENDTGPTGKFRIDNPEDFVYSVWAEIKVHGKFLGDAAQAGLRINPYFYLSNSIANYEEYQIFARRNFGKHEAGIEYQLDRDAYLRELRHFVDDGVTQSTPYESARYLEHEVEAYYVHHLSEVVHLRGSAGYRIKDFNSEFDFRDLSGFFVSVGPLANLGKGFTAFFRYEFSDMNANPRISEPTLGWTDPDTSYRQHELQFGGAVDLLKGALELSLKYRLAIREYTTGQDAAEDPDHADRNDLRHKVSFRARYKISANWSVRLEYTYRLVASHRPHADESVTSEPGDSSRNTISIGATFAF